VEAGESVRNAEAGRWQAWLACGPVERSALVPQGMGVPNPRLLERCREVKLMRALSGAVCGRGSDRVSK
jgi:hypothetical protein